MIIIIEGPDGSGKSTLAELLAKQTGYKVIHRSKPETDEEKKEMMTMYLDIINKNTNVIFDRCWYSEMVYGPIMRDTTVISYLQMYNLEKLLAKKGAMIIHCTGKPQALWKRANTRGEDYVTEKEQFLEICNAYNEIFSVPHLIPVTTYEVQD